MKKTRKIIFKRISVGILAVFAFSLMLLFSCKDDNEGAPVIVSVHVLDTFKTHKDSLIVGADPGTTIVIHGQNIGGVKSAYFNEYLAAFNTNLNTTTDLIIQIPSTTPVDSTADNTIRLVTSHGEATFAFRVLAKPAITSFDKIIYGAESGYNISFTGKNFKDVVSVVAFRAKNSPTEKVKDSVICQIVSTTSKTLVITIPANTLGRVTLNFTNASGTTYGGDEFINKDVAIRFFTDSFGTFPTQDPGVNVWNPESWDKPFTVNTVEAHSGTKSLSIDLVANGYKWFGFTAYYPQFYYDTQYKYIVFYVKGSTHDFPLWMSSSASKSNGGGTDPVDAGFEDKNKFTAVAHNWNFYRFAIADLDILYSGSVIQKFGFRTKGPGSEELLYFDDVMIIK